MDPIKPPDLASPGFKANPYPFYARLRAEARVYRTTVFPFPVRRSVWVVSRYDDVLAVLKDERLSNDVSAKMPWLPFITPLTRNMLERDPPDHTRLRALAQKAFAPRLIERLRERIQSVCDGLLDAAPLSGRFALVRAYAVPLPVTIIAELLGIPAEDRLRFQSWTRSIVAGASGNVSDLLRGLPKVGLFNRYLRKLFRERRAHPRDDLVTALVQAEEAGDKLSEDELLAMVWLLLVAGHETTTNLIASGTLALIQHPEQRARFEQNPALAKSAIEELLRYTSPADITSIRIAREDVTIGSATIPRGELVLAALGSANHDESQFVDPDALDLAREPNNHLAFGQGAHYCLGAALARLEGQIALTTLFRRFPNLRLAEPPESLRWRKGLFFRGLEKLPVAL